MRLGWNTERWNEKAHNRHGKTSYKKSAHGSPRDVANGKRLLEEEKRKIDEKADRRAQEF